MSAATQTPDLTLDPDPARDTEGAPTAIGRVLRVVRKLIDYGRQLAEQVQQHTAAPVLIARRFGTADLAAILTRITAGLRRAAALETALDQRAAQGHDLTPTPDREPETRMPRPARQDAQPKAPPVEDSHLANLPTEQEIAAEVRQRPVGAVIADICRDLGLTPDQCDRAFWRELSDIITVYGGSLTSFFVDLGERLFTFGYAGCPDPTAPGWMAASLRLLTPSPRGPP